jgi:hypothetical protein
MSSTTPETAAGEPRSPAVKLQKAIVTIKVGKFEQDWTRFSVLIDRMAVDQHCISYLLGCVAPAMNLKALRAALNSGGDIPVSIELPDSTLRVERPEQANGAVLRQAHPEGEFGYSTKAAHLGHGRHHALFLSRSPGFLPVGDPESLWRELSSTRYTTPILRNWVPTLSEQLKKEGLLEPLYVTEGLTCHRLLATTADLDRIVSESITLGRISIPATPEAA